MQLRRLTWLERLTGRIRQTDNRAHVATWYEKEIRVEAVLQYPQGGHVVVPELKRYNVLRVDYLGSRLVSNGELDVTHACSIPIAGYNNDVFSLTLLKPRLDLMYIPDIWHLSVVDYDSQYMTHLFKFYCNHKQERI